jgi:SAM-dependent methyltransferase
MTADSDYWARYYEVTVERPAWQTVRFAIARFADEAAATAGAVAAGAATAGAATARHPGTVVDRPPRFAVDLGSGGGRDARELLRAGWRVLAVDREPGARQTLTTAAGPELGRLLTTQVADLATVEIPPCDLINASLCLPFLRGAAFADAWQRIAGALKPGSRFAAMVFGDRDDSASDPDMTCLAPDRFEGDLADFEIEFWSVAEEDKETALGEPHHFHLIEFVARKVR